MNRRNIQRTKLAAASLSVVAVAVIAYLIAAYKARVGCALTCPSGSRDIGGTCFENCPSGWSDQGFICRGRNSKGQLASRKKNIKQKVCAPDPVAPSASPLLLEEGMSVQCATGDGKVYRYEGGMLRHYPDVPIASAWNPDWAKAIRTLTAVECSAIPVGEPMTMPVANAATSTSTVQPASSATSTTPVAAVCVPSCHVNWKNVGGTCFENCPSKWVDLGLSCRGKNSKGQWAFRLKKSMAPKCITASSPPPDIPETVEEVIPESTQPTAATVTQPTAATVTQPTAATVTKPTVTPMSANTSPPPLVQETFDEAPLSSGAIAGLVVGLVVVGGGAFLAFRKRTGAKK